MGFQRWAHQDLRKNIWPKGLGKLWKQCRGVMRETTYVAFQLSGRAAMLTRFEQAAAKDSVPSFDFARMETGISNGTPGVSTRGPSDERPKSGRLRPKISRRISTPGRLETTVPDQAIRDSAWEFTTGLEPEERRKYLAGAADSQEARTLFQVGRSAAAPAAVSFFQSSSDLLRDKQVQYLARLFCENDVAYQAAELLDKALESGTRLAHDMLYGHL